MEKVMTVAKAHCKINSGTVKKMRKASEGKGSRDAHAVGLCWN